MLSSYLSLSIASLFSSQISACVFLVPGSVALCLMVSFEGPAVSGFILSALFNCLSATVGVFLIDGERRGCGAAVSGFILSVLFNCLSAKVGVFFIDGAFPGTFPVVAVPSGCSRSGVLLVEPALNTGHLLGYELTVCK